MSFAELFHLLLDNFQAMTPDEMEHWIIVVLKCIGILLISTEIWRACIWGPIFEKANVNWYIALVPFYSRYTLYFIACDRDLEFQLSYAPLINIAVHFTFARKLAATFHKKRFFGFMLAVLPCCYMPLLAFGRVRYTRYSRLPRKNYVNRAVQKQPAKKQEGPKVGRKKQKPDPLPIYRSI